MYNDNKIKLSFFKPIAKKAKERAPEAAAAAAPPAGGRPRQEEGLGAYARRLSAPSTCSVG